MKTFWSQTPHVADHTVNSDNQNTTYEDPNRYEKPVTNSINKTVNRYTDWQVSQHIGYQATQTLNLYADGSFYRKRVYRPCGIPDYKTYDFLYRNASASTGGKMKLKIIIALQPIYIMTVMPTIMPIPTKPGTKNMTITARKSVSRILPVTRVCRVTKAVCSSRLKEYSTSPISTV